MRFILKTCFKICLLLLVTHPTQSFAETNDCVKELYEYGRSFTPEKLGSNIVKKTYTKANENGTPGENIFWTTHTSKQNWITTYACKSCSPKKGISELFLIGDRPLPCGLKIYMSEIDITNKIGSPELKQDSNLIYAYPPLEKNQEIRLQLRDGKFYAIHWLFYLD